MFSDGTSMQGKKKVIDIGIHTPSYSYTLGFKPVACEDASTVATVIKQAIDDTARHISENQNSKHEIKNKLLASLTLMSDSVMKKFNSLIDDWRSNVLKENNISDEE